MEEEEEGKKMQNYTFFFFCIEKAKWYEVLESMLQAPGSLCTLFCPGSAPRVPQGEAGLPPHLRDCGGRLGSRGQSFPV